MTEATRNRHYSLMTVGLTDRDAEVTEPQLITIEEFAEAVRAPVATVRHWRKSGYGPQGFRIGKRVMYLAQEVNDFIMAARQAAVGAR